MGLPESPPGAESQGQAHGGPHIDVTDPNKPCTSGLRWASLGGHTRRTPDSAPHLCPRLILICILSNSVPAAKRGSLFIHPSQCTGLSWTGPSQDMELTWAGTRQGSAHRKRACTPRCRPLPAYLLVRADPEHLRVGPELTNSSSWTGL